MKTVLVFWIGGALVYVETFAIWAALRRGEIRLASHLEIARAITAVALVAIFLAGCGASPVGPPLDAFVPAPTACGSWVNVDGETCEAACVEAPSEKTGTRCTIEYQHTATDCPSISFDGATGCCELSQVNLVWRFYGCQP